MAFPILAVAVLGLTAVKGIMSVKAAQDQARAVGQEAQLNAENAARKTRIKAARAQISFISSGLSLAGTPEVSIENLIFAGQKDVSRIRSNAQRQMKSIVGQARNQALFDLATTAASAAASGAFSGGGGLKAGTNQSFQLAGGQTTAVAGPKPSFTGVV